MVTVVDDKSATALETALERLNDVGAVKVEISSTGGEVGVDLTGLVAGALSTISHLLDDVAARSGTSRTEVIFAIREWLYDA